MAREKENYRENLELIRSMYPSRLTITIEEAAAVLGRGRKSLLKDPAFPARLIGGKYAISIVALARYIS
jgi:hypothetical protein